MPEDLVDEHGDHVGRRIADLRIKLGWTQQDLADRVGVSRAAISHIEAAMTDPSERTVVLLAGLFKVEPHELVAGTRYPRARAERLPVVAARHTEVELQLALLDADLEWLERAGVAHAPLVRDRWEARLAALLDAAHDRRERDALTAARRRLTDLT